MLQADERTAVKSTPLSTDGGTKTVQEKTTGSSQGQDIPDRMVRG